MPNVFKKTQIDMMILVLGFYLTEITFRVGLVLVWNWVINQNINQFFFGANELSVWKGLIIVSILHYIFMPNMFFINFITNNKNQNNGG